MSWDQRPDRQEPPARDVPQAGGSQQDRRSEGAWLAEGARIYSVREVANLMGMHISTIKRIPASELPYLAFGSRGDRRYRHVDVMEYIERRMKR